MKRRRPDENWVVERIYTHFAGGRQNIAGRAVCLDIGDDAALFRPKSGRETILTCDWFLEGTHFLRKKHPPDAVGWKCLARAMSDVAAMGACLGAFS